jgi:hypothetical protein
MAAAQQGYRADLLNLISRKPERREIGKGCLARQWRSRDGETVGIRCQASSQVLYCRFHAVAVFARGNRASPCNPGASGRIILDHGNPRSAMMAIQIVMDRTGDSRHRFDPNDARELAKAEQRFRELTGAGFTAAIRTGPGQVCRIRSFDPNAEEMVFFPRLVGG